MGERIWTNVEPGEYSLSDYEVSKKLIRLHRHGSLPRDDDGAIEFWRIKDDLQEHFPHCPRWSPDKWQKSMAGGRGNKKGTSIVLIHPEQLSISELLKVIQDAISLIYYTGQCCYSEQLLPIHLSCRMCNQNTFHHQFGIDTGRSKFKQQIESILSVCGSLGQESQGS